MIKLTINIYNLHHPRDCMRIDKKLKMTAGIDNAVTDNELQQIRLLFDPDRISEQDIISIVDKLGFDSEIYHE